LAVRVCSCAIARVYDFARRCRGLVLCCSFFFMDAATTEIYTLSLHDALPISCAHGVRYRVCRVPAPTTYRNPALLEPLVPEELEDRKSTRLNSSHVKISYAVFCLKKKKLIHYTTRPVDAQRLRTRTQTRADRL